MTTPRVLFLESCNEVAGLLSDKDFKVLQKGQTLKKTAAHKDLTHTISFESSGRNSSASIAMRVSVSIASKKVKPLWAAQTGRENDLVFHEQLGYLAPRREWKEWNLAGASRKNCVAEVADWLNQYALPVFQLFETPEAAIAHLKTHGRRFNPLMEDGLEPLAFILCHGTKEDAQQFFHNYVQQCPWKKQIFNLYESLQTTPPDFGVSGFYGDHYVKLAWLNGLLPE
jgi:hypothetical protein